MKLHLSLFGYILLVCQFMQGQDINSLPLFNMDNLSYEGAFRLPSSTYGNSSLNFSEGPIAYNAENNSLFIVGHSHEQAIAEFAIPQLVNSTSLDDLNIANTPLQVFRSFLDDASGGNPQNIDRVGGLYLFNDGTQPKLLINAYEYYDAPGDNSHTSIVINNADDLANSTVDGYYQFEGGAGHTSGWISAIPTDLQTELGGSHITGQSSGIPIISRCSVGPSAFAFDFSGITSPSSLIDTETLLDFSLSNPLNSDLNNSSLTNDIWTHLSRTTYGFIVPGTRTYLTVGYSGGHTSGVCYKCTQNGETQECGGYCAPDTLDYYQYYWLWDLSDFMEVKNGTLQPHEVVPYDHGEFITPFQNYKREIGGGSFDSESGILYLSIQRADDQQGTYSNPPVIVTYSTNTALSTEEENPTDAIIIFPNPTSGRIEIKTSLNNYTIRLYDVLGKQHKRLEAINNDIQIDISSFAEGVYFLVLEDNEGTILVARKIVKRH